MFPRPQRMNESYSKLRSSGLFRELTDQDISRILEAAQPRFYASGEHVCRQGELGSSMFVIASGQVKVVVERGGEEHFLNYLAEDEHFGEMALLIGGPRSTTITATMDTNLLEIDRDQFEALLKQVPGFAVNLSRQLGTWLREEITSTDERTFPHVVAVIRSSVCTVRVAQDVAQVLTADATPITVLSDRAGDWGEPEDPPVEQMADANSGPAFLTGTHEQLSEAAAETDRVMVDIEVSLTTAPLLMQCESVWWLVDVTEYTQSLSMLRGLLIAEPKLAERVRLIWMIKEGAPLPAPVDHGIELKNPELRVAWNKDADGRARLRRHDTARLAHLLQGLHLGLVLGGGGARGFAHIGVLQVFEREGLYCDRIAGTSIGAMVGVLHAAGLDQKAIAEVFAREIAPPHWLHWLPKYELLFMLAMYRLGLGRRRLVRRMGAYTFEKLLIPSHTVSVDLIGGEQVVRESGEVAEAVLESINLPGVALPILRDGKAMVDGGVLNNLPVDVIRDRGANFVVSVDIGAKLSNEVRQNTPATPRASMKQLSTLSTILRVSEIQQYGLQGHNLDTSDFLITPDTSAFQLEDFTRGEELIEIGRATAQAVVGSLKQRLRKLVAA